jgi:hypothetical protein
MSKDYKIETTPYGEFKMNARLSGVTSIEEQFGIPIAYTHPISKQVIIYDSIMEAYKNTGLYPAVILECLHNRYKKNPDYNQLFHLQYNDFAHSFKNGSSDMVWYNPTNEGKYDTSKHSEKIPGDIKRIDLWNRTNMALGHIKYDKYEVMENSPIIYTDTSGEKFEYQTIAEFADEYWLHPIHIMEALAGYGELSTRFQYPD